MMFNSEIKIQSMTDKLNSKQDDRIERPFDSEVNKGLSSYYAPQIPSIPTPPTSQKPIEPPPANSKSDNNG